MAKTNKYWVNRAIMREQEAYLKGAAASTKMFKEYERAAASIRKSVNDFYARYAKEQKISFEDAMKRLNTKELQEWRDDLAGYVERIRRTADPALKKRLKAELDALSYNSRITRLEALNGQINMELNGLYVKGVEQMKNEFGELFSESYYKKLFDLQQRAGYINQIAKISPEMIDDVLTYPWSGEMFSSRLWLNKQRLVFNMRETLTQGLIKGDGVATMSKALSNLMGQSYKNAERLVRTETNHFHNAAERRAYEAAGVEEYEFMATLDSRTSEICGNLDGKHFKLKNAIEGVNYPPMHPNCRSTTVEYDPADAADWAEVGKEMPRNMTYEEWANKQSIKEG